MGFELRLRAKGTLAAVLLLPVMAPLLIQGLTVDSWSLAKPLILMVLLPLPIGTAIRAFAPNVAQKMLPVAQKIGMVYLLIALALTLVLYGREMLGTVGSFATGAQVLFFIANPPVGLLVMIVLVVPLAAIVADVAARLFARRFRRGFRNGALAWGSTGGGT